MKDNKLSELKAAAMAATPGPWESVYDDWSDGEDALISCESRNGMVPIAKIEGGGSNSGYNEPFSAEQQANALYIAVANPAVVLDVLAELEAKDKRIAELEALKADASQVLKEIGNELGCKPDNESIMVAIDYLKATQMTGPLKDVLKRNIELEAKLATPVRLTDERTLWAGEDDYDTGHVKGWNANRIEQAALLKKQGFTVEGANDGYPS